MTNTTEYLSDSQALLGIAMMLQQFSGQGLIEAVQDIMVSNGAGFFDDANRFCANRG